MNNEKPLFDTKVIANFKRQFNNSGKLLWSLFTHPRVPIWAKVIPFTAFLYWLNPIDPLPFPLNVLPLDDVAAVWLGIKLFIELCPQDLVANLRHEIEFGVSSDNNTVIDASYQVLDDD